MSKHTIRLIATDLDGTFLNNDKSISSKNIDALNKLGEHNIRRVIVTGRNMEKVKEVVPENIPFDFIIFSSGAGIYDCYKKELIYSQNMPQKTAILLANLLIESKISFNVFHPVPKNHKYWYYNGKRICDEFRIYHDYNKSNAKPFSEIQEIDSDVSQFLIILPEEPSFLKMKEQIQNSLDNIEIIRTTSPLGTGNIWMEIFFKNVSKGKSLSYLSGLLNIEKQTTLGIGNDYNDLDLLHFTNYSFIVGNAPEDLKKIFINAPVNEEDAFSYVVDQVIMDKNLF